ncbi:MAG: hypothetical protein R2684_16910 [Pyrinomonadaceae bacterium]
MLNTQTVDFEEIRKLAIEDAAKLIAEKHIADEIKSQYFSDARTAIDTAFLERTVKMKPDKTSGRALAKTIAAFGPLRLYNGRITLFKPFFYDYNLAIGSMETSDSLGISMRDRRALTLLHELTHLTRRYIDAFQIVGLNYFDEAIYDKSTINKRIYDAWKRG